MASQKLSKVGFESLQIGTKVYEIYKNADTKKMYESRAKTETERRDNTNNFEQVINLLRVYSQVEKSRSQVFTETENARMKQIRLQMGMKK